MIHELSPLNEPYAIKMRKRIIEKENILIQQEQKQQMGLVRFYILRLLKKISFKDKSLQLKEVNSLDSLAKYCTLEEMAELLGREQVIVDEQQPGVIPVFFYNIHQDYTIAQRYSAFMTFHLNK